MPSSKTFLELQSSAPGLPGPYLVENLVPYQILDELGSAKPKAILAIGSSRKRQFLTSRLLVNHSHRDRSVGLYCQPDETLLFDCELHLQDDSIQDMPRFQIKRPWGGGLNGHVLELADHSAAHIAYKLYGEVLAPFSDVILVFVPDLGLTKVVELFCHWFKSTMQMKFPRSQRILLLHDGAPSAQHVHSCLVSAFASMLRSSDALQAYTNADIRQKLTETFYITNIALWSSTLTSEINKALADSVLWRATHCLDFEARHFKYLLQAAIRHYAEQPSRPFDVITASRVQSHLFSDGRGDALSDFLGSRPDIGKTDIALVASALVLDAYPAGAHWFPPELVFERFYREVTEQCGRQLRSAEFSHAVKLEFIATAMSNRAAKSDILDGHLLRIRRDWVIRNAMALASCSLCILRAPHWTLDCEHRLCRECILSYGTLEVPWRPKLLSCPVCQSRNSSAFIVRPPTAGIRTLDLGGTDGENVLHFLRDLRRGIGLSSMAFRDHFDGVVGSDSGMFFVIAGFLEGWDLADCAHHLSGLKTARLRGTSTVAFGKHLIWDLSKSRLYNNKEVSLAFRKKILRYSGQSTNEEAEIYVRYRGGPYSRESLESTCNSLVAALFYIELDTLPNFYSGSERCMLRLQCRVPPGPALLDLVYRLYRRRTRLCYGCNELDQTRIELCTEDVVRSCRNYRPFMRVLLVEVSSPDDSVSIHLESASGKYRVSRCPYKVKDLIKDQGLDCPFRRRDSRPNPPFQGTTLVEMETWKLLELLQTMK